MKKLILQVLMRLGLSFKLPNPQPPAKVLTFVPRPRSRFLMPGEKGTIVTRRRRRVSVRIKGYSEQNGQMVYLVSRPHHRQVFRRYASEITPRQNQPIAA